MLLTLINFKSLSFSKYLSLPLDPLLLNIVVSFATASPEPSIDSFANLLLLTPSPPPK